MNWNSWAPPAFGRVPIPWRTGRRRRMPPLILLKRGLVLVALLLILSGGGSWLWVRLGSLIEVASVHSRPMCLVSDPHIPHRIGGTSGLLVPTYPMRCTSLRSSQFWVANHDILGLVENDREFLRNVLPGRQLFCDISSTFGTVSLLQFYRAEHHGVAPSWLRSAG